MNKSIQNGFSQIFVLVGMLLIAASLPLATKLAQQKQDERSHAAENYFSQSSFKVAFKGIKPSYLDENGNSYNCFDQLEDISVNFVSKSGKIYQSLTSVFIEPVAGETNSNGDQIFKISNFSLNNRFSTTGTNNYIHLKNSFSLSVNLCLDNQNNKTTNTDSCNIDLNDNKIYNFSNYSLNPGDINQDDLVNSIDYATLKNNFNSEDGIVCGQTGDFNLDGRTNSLDVSLLKSSLSLTGDELNTNQFVEIYLDSENELEDNTTPETEDITAEVTFDVTPESSSPTPTLTPTQFSTLTPTLTITQIPTSIPTPTPTQPQQPISKTTKIIFLGDSRVVLLAGHNGKYKINYGNKDIVFVAKGGTRYSDWFENNSKYMKKIYNIVDKLSDQKCAIIIGLAGNDLNHITASSTSQGRQKIIDLTVKYKNSLVSLANKYTNQCTVYFTSVNPVQLHKKVTVYSYNSSKALTKTGRSNIKIETFNNSLKSLIESANINNLKYIDTNNYFVESKDKLKNGYNTSDGTHYNAKTIQLVYNKTIELSGL